MAAREKEGWIPIRRDLETMEQVAEIVREYARREGKDPRKIPGLELREMCGIEQKHLQSLGGLRRLREILLIEEGYVAPTGREEIESAIDKIVRSCKKGGVSLVFLADLLDVSPKRVKSYLDECRARGIDIHVEDGHVATKRPQRAEVIDSSVKPVVGEPFKIAVISDTHLGSKYCMRAQLRDFVIQAKAEGCQAIVHAGDVLDGDYRHGVFELTHHGLEDQVRDLVETWPSEVDLPVFFITGNHDETFWGKTGVNVGKTIEREMQEAGHPWKHVGDRNAFIEIGGTVLNLWHPKVGAGYAKSYKLQKKAEGFTSLKPQIMIAGHWHQFSYVDDRAIHSMSGACFQGGGSKFGKSLPGSIAMGGTIIQWQVTEDGTVRRFSLERHSYYEIEEPIKVNVLPGTMVPQAISRQTSEPDGQ